jgi:hypothetical protein
MRKRINRCQIAVIFVGDIPKRHFKSVNEVIQFFTFIYGSKAMENGFTTNLEEEKCFHLVFK